jgi:hypothetical protein
VAIGDCRGRGAALFALVGFDAVEKLVSPPLHDQWFDGESGLHDRREAGLPLGESTTVRHRKELSMRRRDNDSAPIPIDSELATVRAFTRELRIACDDLHANPFDAEARAKLVQMIESGSSAADAALARMRSSPWQRGHASGQ